MHVVKIITWFKMDVVKIIHVVWFIKDVVKIIVWFIMDVVKIIVCYIMYVVTQGTRMNMNWWVL